MQRQVVERNMRFLVIEIFWAAIFTGCVSFNAAYLIRLGGSNFLVTLLTSGAALVNALTAIPFAAFLERRARHKPWLVGSLSTVRFGYATLIVVPWLPADWRPIAMVTLLLLLNIPAALFITSFLPMMADVIPIERRARIFAARNITMGATVSVATLVLGKWLDLVAFPFNYQVLYALGVITAAVSTFFVGRLVVPDAPEAPPPGRTRISRALFRTVATQQRPFMNITINTLIFNIGAWMAIPLQPIYFVRVLGASDGWLGRWLAIVSVGTILGNMLWRRLIDRYGLSWVLRISTALSAVYFVLIGLTPNLNLILAFALMAGVVNPGIDLSHLSILLETCPPERRAMYLSVFTTIMNIGLFLSPLAVAPLTDALGAPPLLVVLGGLRLGGAILFMVNPVHVTTETGLIEPQKHRDTETTS